MALLKIKWAPADLLAHFVAPALVVATLLTLILALLRLAPGLVTGLVTMVLLSLALWPQVFPAPSQKANPESPEIRVYFANLLVFNQEVEAIQSSVTAADADLLVLVEMGSAVHAEAERLFADYPYRLDTRASGRQSRTALYSRYPLKRLDLSNHSETLAARVETPLGPINLVGAHLTRPWPYKPQGDQLEQVGRLAEVRAALDGPVILAGDFNSVSSGLVGRTIKSDLGLIPAPAWPGTWPQKLPSFLGITIDHIWHSPGLVLTSRKLGQPTGSDHRPVIATFKSAAE